MVIAKRVLITGGNTGIGFEAARQLLHLGHHVVIACRDPKKGQKAVDALSPVAKANGASVESTVLDLASLASIRKGAAHLLERHPQLDVLLCNAGVLSRSSSADPLVRTEDGHELTFQVNHLGHFLLVHLLLPALLAAPSARIVIVSSELHRRATKPSGVGPSSGGGDIQDAAQPSGPSAPAAAGSELLPLASAEWLTSLSAAGSGRPRPTGFQLYCISKLYNLWFTYHLAAMLPPTVKVNAVTPGWVPGTTLGRDMPWFARLAYQYFFPLLPGTTSVAEGGRRVVSVCVGEQEGGVTGTYFSQGIRTESSPESQDKGAAKRLWQLSEAAAGVERFVPPLPKP